MRITMVVYLKLRSGCLQRVPPFETVMLKFHGLLDNGTRQVLDICCAFLGSDLSTVAS